MGSTLRERLAFVAYRIFSLAWLVPIIFLLYLNVTFRIVGAEVGRKSCTLNSYSHSNASEATSDLPTTKSDSLPSVPLNARWLLAAMGVNDGDTVPTTRPLGRVLAPTVHAAQDELKSGAESTAFLKTSTLWSSPESRPGRWWATTTMTSCLLTLRSISPANDWTPASCSAGCATRCGLLTCTAARAFVML